MKLTLLVGPPGSGKSTIAKQMIEGTNTVYINQDSQGRFEHTELFQNAIYDKKDVIVDRMNFNKQQRFNYLGLAEMHGYDTSIIVLHQPYKVCLDRIRARFGKHETIHDEKAARGALQTFFGKYERPTEDEADSLKFVYPTHEKPSAIICDLDGTLSDCSHRRHHVRPPTQEEVIEVRELGDLSSTLLPVKPFKKDWKAFFDGIPNDPINKWCKEILHTMGGSHCIVLCTGRDSNQQRNTVDWLKKHDVRYDDLFMRDRSDSRQDWIVKEIILDFEILTRYTPYMFIDDRKQVVDMWRRRGFVCLQCDEGDF